MLGKRTYCILGTMLLAIATLGSGVSAEQSNERLSDLEDLGILELSMDDGVIEAMVTTDAFLTFMNSDEVALLVIESIDMNVGLSDEGELELTEIDIGVGEEQSDEIAVTLRLSDELVELLQDEDLDSEDLLRELGFGDDLGLDDFNPEVADDYWHSRTYWADEAYQVRGSQADYDAVMDSEEPEEEFYRVLEEFEENYDELIEDTFGARLHWADEAYQIRGSQADYDRVMVLKTPQMNSTTSMKKSCRIGKLKKNNTGSKKMSKNWKCYTVNNANVVRYVAYSHSMKMETEPCADWCTTMTVKSFPACGVSSIRMDSHTDLEGRTIKPM